MSSRFRVALVTGGAQGIGRQISLGLAASGFFVVVVNKQNLNSANSVVSEIEKAGGLSITYQADLSVVREIKELIYKVNRDVGAVDVLVNNAAVFNPKPIEEVSETDWDAELNINLKACFFLCKEVVPAMKRKKWGRIINISSIAGVGGFPNSSPYCASKGGLNNMTKALCLELAPFGINVNAIAPGNVATPMNKTLREDSIWCEKLKDRTPTNQDFLLPNEIAGAAVFLSSNQANSIHGIVLPVDSGWRAW